MRVGMYRGIEWGRRVIGGIRRNRKRGGMNIIGMRDDLGDRMERIFIGGYNIE